LRPLSRHSGSDAQRARRTRIKAVGLALLVWAAVALAQNEEARLAELRERIVAIQAEIDRDLARRDQARARLQEAERAASAASRDLGRTRGEISTARDESAALRAERDRLRGDLLARQEDLAELARAVYLTGRQPRLRLLLNQEDPARLGRMLAWHGYAAGAQATRVDEVRGRIAELAAVESSLAAEAAKLEALAARQAEETSRLEQARAERAGALAAVERRIEEQGGEKARLETEAATLEDLIAELRKALADLPGAEREPFTTQKGRLSWPVSGRLLRDFGQPRGGGMRWRGVLVAAPRGAEVRAAYHGRVAYADWLPGMGLLVIVDHGEGYLSLYGHNEALYKSVGEWVVPGEVLAAAGNSGGNEQTAVYLEIRKGTRPENPHRWFGQRISAR
jgi:septal ring factor EnvC (AmiA/AmiB activator)